MKIDDMKIKNFNLRNIIRDENYDIVGYKINKVTNMIEIKKSNGEVYVIDNTPHNIEVCNYQIDKNFSDVKENMEKFCFILSKVNKYTLISQVLFSSLIVLSETNLISILPSLGLITGVGLVNIKYQIFLINMNHIKWVKDNQNLIDIVLKDEEIKNKFHPKTIISIENNDQKYNLNNYDEVDVNDRIMIKKKVLSNKKDDLEK